MSREQKMAYETMGASSYMTVTLPPKADIVSYQLEMMLSNEIENFLPVSRQMLDGKTVIYYNITSRIPLKQILDKRKLSRKELIRLLEGIILAVRDAATYRLPETGFVLETEYIYVNPASCSPAFMFLPLPESAGPGIKEFISGLVVHDKIELSDDNFIQVILMELNRQPFSLDQLEKCLKPYKKTPSGMQEQSPKAEIFQQGKPIPTQQKLEPKSIQTEERRRELDVADRVVFSEEPKKGEIPDLPRRKGARNGKNAEKQDRTDEFDQKKAKHKFLLPQLLFMAALTAGVSFGMFTNESGGIAPKNILAFAIVAALAEWLLYREIYVNGRSSKKIEEKKAPTGKKLPSGKKTGRPEVPAQKENPYQESQKSVSSWPDIQPAAVPVREQHLVPPIYGGEEEMDTEGETEFWSGGAENRTPAYLEYLENGRLNRIPVDTQNGVVVGRLKQQVDFEVKSPRVGKVHAKFFCQEGQCYVVDINSKNGTYINGSRARIESNVPHPIHDKDRITLADSEFIIRCSES